MLTRTINQAVMTKNMKAFMDMIAVSEIGAPLLAVSDNGYNVIVGSTAKKPILFHDYSDHPRRLITLRPGLRSSAAGRYQILARYFDTYKRTLKLKNFSPAAQDAIAIRMITEQSAKGFIEAGNIEEAIKRCRNIWASFPGAGYGQREHGLEFLVDSYTGHGGVVA